MWHQGFQDFKETKDVKNYQDLCLSTTSRFQVISLNIKEVEQQLKDYGSPFSTTINKIQELEQQTEIDRVDAIAYQ